MNAAGPAQGVDIDAVHRTRTGAAPDTPPRLWSQSSQALLRCAYASGRADGERAGYVQGFRYGHLHWFCIGFLAGAATVAACLLAGIGVGA